MERTFVMSGYASVMSGMKCEGSHFAGFLDLGNLLPTGGDGQAIAKAQVEALQAVAIALHR